MTEKLVLDRTPRKPFVPPRIIRHNALQAALTTLRTDIPESLLRWGWPLLIDAGPDETGASRRNVQLLAYYTPQRTHSDAKGAVVLLHGWEGCSHSNYNLVTMRTLVNAGYDVFRLNLRDHGPGLHVHPQALNAGVFLGTLLAEAVSAVSYCADMVHPLPVYIAGFSIGGNFALRMAIRHASTPIPNLRRVVAVNPAINPYWSTLKIDANLWLRRHFRQPWLKQLLEKQRYYPALYDFEPVKRIDSLVDMTNWLVRYSGYYRDAEEYFSAYSVIGAATKDLSVSTRIITSLDDVIVPVSDIYGLEPGPKLKVDLHQYGGHVGYMDGFPLQHKVGDLVLQGLTED